MLVEVQTKEIRSATEFNEIAFLAKIKLQSISDCLYRTTVKICHQGTIRSATETWSVKTGGL